jgi:hypothetical protein
MADMDCKGPQECNGYATPAVSMAQPGPGPVSRHGNVISDIWTVGSDSREVHQVLHRDAQSSFNLFATEARPNNI